MMTPTEFFDVLERSRLLSAPQFAEARTASVGEGEDAAHLARVLVRRNLLTRWQASQLLAGRTAFLLGKYKLIEILGRGGMGKVFLAEHTAMNRRVAIKVLERDLGKEPRALERFLAEARAAAALDHQNIVHAYNVDSTQGRYYLVMEYVEGMDLLRLVETEGPLDFARAIDYIRQAAEGLDHAHAQRMIHCDIKPSNLLVNTQGVVKILDMGLAQLVEEDGKVPDVEQHILGSVDYLAPEQAVGGPDFDHRADIYALGCTLYFALTGRPPFPDGSLHERILKHQTQMPKSILAQREDVPSELVRICEKMMAKAPADRYQSAREVVDALSGLDFSARKLKKAVPLQRRHDSVSADLDGLESIPLLQELEHAAAEAMTAATSGPHAIVAPRFDEPQNFFATPAGIGLLAGGGGLLLVVLIGVILAARSTPPKIAEKGPLPPPSIAAPAAPAPPAGTAVAPAHPNPSPGGEPPSGSAATGNTNTAPATVPPQANSDTANKSRGPKQSKKGPRKSLPQKGVTPPGGESEAADHDRANPDATHSGHDEDSVPPTAPPSADTTTPSGGPFEQMPGSVSLPSLSDAETVAEPVALGSIRVPQGARLDVALIGGESAMKGTHRFRLAEENEGKAWTIARAPFDGPGDATPVAHLTLEGAQLRFQWGPRAAAERGGHLQNCGLLLRCAGDEHFLPLVEPKPANPLVVNFVNNDVQLLTIDYPPRHESLMLRVTGLSGRWDGSVSPEDIRPIVDEQDQVQRIALTLKDFAFGKLLAQAGGYLDSRQLRLALAPALALSGERAAREVHGANPNQVADLIRKAVNTMRAAKSTRQEYVDELKNFPSVIQAIHQRCRVHYEICIEAEGRSIVLYRTISAAQANAADAAEAKKGRGKSGK